jgi:peptide/nickel transport system ATP-binding protein
MSATAIMPAPADSAHARAGDSGSESLDIAASGRGPTEDDRAGPRIHARSPGRQLGIVGESGSGKSLTAKRDHRPAARRMCTQPRRHPASTGSTCWTPPSASCRAIPGVDDRARHAGSVTMLHPLQRVRRHHHEVAGARGCAATAAAHGYEVVAAPRRGRARSRGRRGDATFELSGGMRQRVGISGRTREDPALLIADEPTIRELDASHAERGPVAPRQHPAGTGNEPAADHARPGCRVRRLRPHPGPCMRARSMELGAADDLRTDPQHPYTRALMRAAPPISRVLDHFEPIRATSRVRARSIPSARSPRDASSLPPGLPLRPPGARRGRIRS